VSRGDRGTLGGNHFIELCVDESNGVWVMLNSGSRNGKTIGETTIHMARQIAEGEERRLRDRDLDEGSAEFDMYIEGLRIRIARARQSGTSDLSHVYRTAKP
jgi:tRNA-splicing ligase RtcB